MRIIGRAGDDTDTRPGKSRHRLRVAHVTTIDQSLRYLLLHQLLAIRSAGYDVSGVSAPGREVRHLQDAGIHHFAVPMTRAMSPLTDLLSLAALYRLFRRERFDIVHTHTPKGGLLGQHAALFARTPVRVHTVHGMYLPAHATGWRRRLFLKLEQATMRFSHHNLSQNPEDIPTAIRERLVSPERIEFLGNGIDLQEFRPARLRPEERDAKRRELGLGPEHVVVGMVARVVREKGYVEALQAARNLRPRFPKARYLFVGDFDGDKPDALSRSILDEFGLSTEVSFLGHRTDVSDLYAAMDVFILPSYREGFPRAPMEAAASGIPAIVTDTRGCRETVVHDVTGYLVPVADADALGDSLARLLADPELRARFGAAARQKAIAEFDEQIVFQRVLRTYSRLVERKLRGRARDAAS